eukprot:scaffold82847_cov71-Phaeocystis_antarctica.AAC.5
MLLTPDPPPDPNPGPNPLALPLALAPALPLALALALALTSRRLPSQVGMASVEAARDKMLIGVARHTAVVSATDRWLTAVHEAGHALVAKLTEGANPVQKVTIVPHSMQGGSAGGVTVMRPREGDHVHVQHLSAQLDVCMGGRAAEELFAGRKGVSVGAEMDFREARRLAVCPALTYNHLQPRATP